LEVVKGLLEDVEEVLKGLVDAVIDVEVENGFEEDEVPVGLTPNKPSPIFVEVMEFTCDREAGFDSPSSLRFRRSLTEASEILTPLKARTLPSLRLHVFRRQVNTYSRLSCPGKTSGKSPFSWRSKTIRSLHTLHLTRAADGGRAGSSQVYEIIGR
jgi:hypothetical protein